MVDWICNPQAVEDDHFNCDRSYHPKIRLPMVNLFIAGLSGAAIPLIMKRIGLDPAQSANIILTTITDVIGFFAFLGLTVLFISYLV